MRPSSETVYEISQYKKEPKHELRIMIFNSCLGF